MPERDDQKLLLEAISVQATLERFGLSEADDDEAALGTGEGEDPGIASNVAGGDHYKRQRRNAKGQFGDSVGYDELADQARRLLRDEKGFTMDLAGKPYRK